MDLIAAVDLSEDAPEEVAAAVAWAERLAATLHLRTVSTLRWADRPVPPDPAPGEETWRRLRQLEADALAGLLQAVPEANRGTAEVVHGALDAVASGASVDAELVICATHGRRGLPRLFSGSASEALVRGAGRPVLVARLAGVPSGPVRTGRILVAIDPGSPSTAALSLVRSWFPEAHIDVTGVLADHEPLTDRDVGPAQAQVAPGDHPQRAWALQRLTSCLSEAGFEAEPSLLLAGRHSVGSVLSEAAEVYDLIAVTTHGRRGLARLWWGSVAERLVRLAPVPVLVVPIEAQDG